MQKNLLALPLGHLELKDFWERKTPYLPSLQNINPILTSVNLQPRRERPGVWAAASGGSKKSRPEMSITCHEEKVCCKRGGGTMTRKWGSKKTISSNLELKPPFSPPTQAGIASILQMRGTVEQLFKWLPFFPISSPPPTMLVLAALEGCLRALILALSNLLRKRI